jgi:hypothetical protein
MKCHSFVETLISFLEGASWPGLVCAVLSVLSQLQNVIGCQKKITPDRDFVREFDTLFYTVTEQFSLQQDVSRSRIKIPAR